MFTDPRENNEEIKVWTVVGDLAMVVQAAENRRFRIESCRCKGETKRIGAREGKGGIDATHLENPKLKWKRSDG